ncbi:hypothetical protein GBA52_024846 [Prunus armeniaca]|nr:hypothetical protein GBA52_024846 [Prunus armeniaca]
MIIICWNVRGAACTKFRPTVMELICNHHVDILFLCEPRISRKKVANTMKSLGFPCNEIVDSISFFGGLWLLWKDTNVNIEIIGTTDQSITTCVTSPGKTSTQQARVMKDCLEKFCRASGQTINFEKSAIYCSPNTGNALATEISCMCGSPLTENLGQYLGMPLLLSRVSHNTHRKLVDKVSQRLAAWKRNLLSMAGRATLIQAVTAAIHVYSMQTAKLHMSTCKDLDCVN